LIRFFPRRCRQVVEGPYEGTGDKLNEESGGTREAKEEEEKEEEKEEKAEEEEGAEKEEEILGKVLEWRDPLVRGDHCRGRYESRIGKSTRLTSNGAHSFCGTARSERSRENMVKGEGEGAGLRPFTSPARSPKGTHRLGGRRTLDQDREESQCGRGRDGDGERLGGPEV
jgi:hypothetical protein